MHKAQVSMETVVILSFAFMTTIVLVGVFFYWYSDHDDTVNIKHAQQTARVLADKINEVYSLGEDTKTTFRIYLPNDITNITIENGEVLINVTDYGVGIHKKHLPRLFERFYRIDKARSRNMGGTGLGLAIVKHIVQVHNGRVEVKSKPGHGSTFYIYIPV